MPIGVFPVRRGWGLAWVYALAGLLGFTGALAFDFASLRGLRWSKRIAGFAAGLLGLFAILVTATRRPRLVFPSYVGVTGWILLSVSLLLLIYSLFIEIPFVQTYGRPGTGDRLVTTGTYALCRHPGVLWFSIFIVSLFLVSGSKQLLTAGPVWIGADWLYAWVQDRHLFPLMFSGYPDYRLETPMFVPTRASVRSCVGTICRSP